MGLLLALFAVAFFSDNKTAQSRELVSDNLITPKSARATMAPTEAAEWNTAPDGRGGVVWRVKLGNAEVTGYAAGEAAAQRAMNDAAKRLQAAAAARAQRPQA